jgi:hypothetical protein
VIVASAERTREARQQKDNLCGPFWAARILRDAGIEEWGGETIDEDLLALRAGTSLPEPDGGSVPPGAASRTGYRFVLPRVPPERSGTAAGALAATIESAAGGRLRCLPLRGGFTAERVAAMLEGAARLRGARLLANLDTGGLWGSRPAPGALVAELRGEQVEGPPADWGVGHFCELELLVRGAGGALVVVHDSYPSLGLEGRHLQPPRAVAAALRRADGREGGVLVVTPTAEAARAEALARTLGLEIGSWDNGTGR